MKRFLLIAVIAVFVGRFCETPASGTDALQKSSLTPFSISDTELQKISKDQIIATVKHLIAINKELLATVERQKNNLADATNSQTNALNAGTKSLEALTNLQTQIDTLAKHDKAETDRANKLDKALWWYRLHWWGAWIMLGLGVVACLVFAFLKFTGRLAIGAGV